MRVISYGVTETVCGLIRDEAAGWTCDGSYRVEGVTIRVNPGSSFPIVHRWIYAGLCNVGPGVVLALYCVVRGSKIASLGRTTPRPRDLSVGAPRENDHPGIMTAKLPLRRQTNYSNNFSKGNLCVVWKDEGATNTSTYAPPSMTDVYAE